MTADFCEALRLDLGRQHFVTWFSETSLLERDIQHAIDHLKSWAKEEVVDTPFLIGPGTSKILREPYGVVLIMGAWNFPIYTTLCPLIYAIAAGNCAIIKPSELSPHISQKMKSLITRYLDSSAYIAIQGAVEVAKSITTYPFDLIMFTGGSEKGKLVASAAAKNLVPCILELGGKSPCVIDDSADVELAAKKVAFGRYINAG